jgi:uncharacterized protein YjbI with pentapeptide repeats
MIFSIRSIWGEVIHQVELGNRKMGTLGSFDATWMDFRGLDFTNPNLRSANLSYANLEGAILLGADLTEACLRNANLRNVDARYCDFAKADLRGAHLENADVYPSQFFKTHFWGARMTSGSDVERYAQIAQDETWNGAKIKPGSVAFRKLCRINGRTCGLRRVQDQIQTQVPVSVRRKRCFVEGL